MYTVPYTHVTLENLTARYFEWRILFRYSANRVCGTQRSIDHYVECSHWFMDGTFKTSPRQFFQLYSVPKKYSQENSPSTYFLGRNYSPESLFPWK